MKEITIIIPKDLWLQIRMSKIHNKLTEKEQIINILKLYYSSRNED